MLVFGAGVARFIGIVGKAALGGQTYMRKAQRLSFCPISAGAPACKKSFFDIIRLAAEDLVHGNG